MQRIGVVLGCGKAGRSVIEYLLAKGQRVLLSENRTPESMPPELLQFLREHEVEVEFGGHTLDFILQADFLVPSPGIPLDAEILVQAAARGLEICGELGLAADQFSVPVVAVTGSNGKTTVTSLIGALLEQWGKRVFVGGNIGTPLLQFFDDEKGFDVAVLELSSFQLELVGSFRTDISVILNISPDHLDRHHSLEAYAQAKHNLTTNQQSGDVAVLGGDDPMLKTWVLSDGVQPLWFGQEESNHAMIDADCIHVHKMPGEPQCFNLANSSLDSLVNRLNAAAAILACKALQQDSLSIQKGLERYVPPPHRMAEVAVLSGVRYINDSKATNVGAMAAALKSCSGQVILVAGGRDKDGDFSLASPLVEEKVRHLIVLGEAAETIAQVYKDLTPLTRVTTMEEAVAVAQQNAHPGDTVLLAPGCASFDMFSGYGERGEVFTKCVNNLRPSQS